MELTELKQKWGKYCDVEKLHGQMTVWFNRYRIRNTPQGICAMLDKFFQNKEDLIQLLQSSNNYIEDLRIELNTSMCRYSDSYKVRSFVNRFNSNVESHKAILKNVDADGKKLADYIKIGKTKITVEELINGNVGKAEFGRWRDKFTNEGYTQESEAKNRTFNNLMYDIGGISSPTVSKRNASELNSHNSALKIAEGTKTPRVFNKICTAYGVDKLPKYNKLFAEYADMVSEAKRNIKFYISVNPIDYLTMSVGRSWNSCHAPGGGYFSGTVSYMLDKVSFITYVFDARPDNFATEGKIYRNMFHYKDGVLLQNRVYPQANDGLTNLYDEFRGFVQQEFADILGKKNEWYKTQANIRSVGNHYRDYNMNRSCNTSSIGRILETNMEIGHINICPNCGREEHISTSRIAHDTCSL